MFRLEYFNGKTWVHCGEWANETLAWISLGGDDKGYRTVNIETNQVMTDNT